MRKANVTALVVALFLCLLLTASGWAFKVPVATNGVAESNPAVAYNPVNHQHMVVWEHEYGAGNTDIHARLVHEYGYVLTEFTVADTGNMETSPQVIYNQAEQEYVVVWANNITGGTAAGSHQILAERYSYDGSYNGNFEVTSNIENDTRARYRPVIAYNLYDDNYLIAWEYEWSATDMDIYAQRFDLDGTPAGSTIYINSTNDERNPATSYGNGPNHDYFIVWQEKIFHTSLRV